MSASTRSHQPGKPCIQCIQLSPQNTISILITPTPTSTPTSTPTPAPAPLSTHTHTLTHTLTHAPYHRAVARSTDGGSTWSSITFDKALNDSVCEASISDMTANAQTPTRGVNNLTVFFNPAMQHMRSRPTLKFSWDNGRTWPQSVLVADSFVDYRYEGARVRARVCGGVEGMGEQRNRNEDPRILVWFQ